jgi:hypothetical protein
MKRRAGEETRTLDIFLGKEVLYQLSYTRVKRPESYEETGRLAMNFFTISASF